MDNQSADGNSRTLTTLTAVLFLFAGVIQLLLAKWLDAAFYLFAGFFFLKVKEIERWPRAARYFVTFVLMALAVAMFVELIIIMKAGARPR